MKLMKKVKELTRWQKVGIAVVALVVVGQASNVAYARSQSRQESAEAQTKLVQQQEVIEQVNQEINDLFSEEKPDFLVENVQEEQVAGLEEKVNQVIVTEELNEKLDTAIIDSLVVETQENLSRLTRTFKQQQAVDHLFRSKDGSDALNGKAVNTELAIKDDLSKQTVDQTKDTTFTTDPTNDFEQVVNDLLELAEDQVKQIETAKVAVSEIYNSAEEKVSSVDQELYDKAKTETEKIKNDKAKNELLDKISQVKEEMDKQAEAKKEQEESQQQATQAAQAAETNVQENQGTTANTTATGAGQTTTPAQGGGTTTGQATPPATGGNSNNNWNQGSAGGGQTVTPPSGGGGNNNTGGGSTGGGGAPTAPAGTFGPFYSDEECLAFARSQGWKGYATIIIDGAMFISPR